MQTIEPIQLENAGDAIRRLVIGASTQTGYPSNMIKCLAQSPGALDGYLQFSRALETSSIDRKQREQIALAVAQANLCEYSLAYHTHLARKVGLTDGQILSSREGRSPDRRFDAVLRFVRMVITQRGDCPPEELKSAGYTDREIVELVALISQYIFENYLNLVARTEMDMPGAWPKLTVA